MGKSHIESLSQISQIWNPNQRKEGPDPNVWIIESLRQIPNFESNPKCLSEIPRIEWTGDWVAIQDGVDMLLTNDVTIILCKLIFLLYLAI